MQTIAREAHRHTHTQKNGHTNIDANAYFRAWNTQRLSGRPRRRQTKGPRHRAQNKDTQPVQKGRPHVHIFYLKHAAGMRQWFRKIKERLCDDMCPVGVFFVCVCCCRCRCCCWPCVSFKVHTSPSGIGQCRTCVRVCVCACVRLSQINNGHQRFISNARLYYSVSRLQII